MDPSMRRFALGAVLFVLPSIVAPSVEAQQSCEEPVPGLVDCVRDKDCIYWPQLSCCDCANGGYEIAINKKKKSELLAQQDICCTMAGCLFFVNCLGFDGARCVDGTCALGSCGDGIDSVQGETCDEGGEAASCDDDCTGVACGDWNVNTSAGETCDDGNTLDGDGCSSACACDDATDLDGDGVGDACDDCVNPAGPATRSVVGLKQVGLDPVVGDDGLRLKMDFALGSGVAFSSLDPSTTGIRLLVRERSGPPVIDVTIPAGPYDGTTGWRASSSGTIWSYVEKAAPPTLAGIRKVRLRDRSSKVPGLVSVQIKGQETTYDVGPYDVPFHVVVTLAAGAGACGEAVYAREGCKVNSKGETIRCR